MKAIFFGMVGLLFDPNVTPNLRYPRPQGRGSRR